MKILGLIIISILIYSVLCAVATYIHFIVRIKKAHISTSKLKLPRFKFRVILTNMIHFILALWYGLLLTGIIGFAACLIDNYTSGITYYIRKINAK